MVFKTHSPTLILTCLWMSKGVLTKSLGGLLRGGDGIFAPSVQKLYGNIKKKRSLGTGVMFLTPLPPGSASNDPVRQVAARVALHTSGSCGFTAERSLPFLPYWGNSRGSSITQSEISHRKFRQAFFFVSFFKCYILV